MLAELLEVRPGVTAVIGGGGKTTLLRALGQELSREHTVLLCTTTKIFPFPNIPCARTEGELTRLRRNCRLMCAGQEVPGTGGKLTVPPVPMARLAEWFDYVLVEADGSAHRPMKAHAPHEPVIPPEANQVICVVGASGFGQLISDAAHRPELYARLAGVSVNTPITPKIAAAVLLDESLGSRFFINQTDTPQRLEKGRELAALLPGGAVVGALQRGEYVSCLL